MEEAELRPDNPVITRLGFPEFIVELTGPLTLPQILWSEVVSPIVVEVALARDNGEYGLESRAVLVGHAFPLRDDEKSLCSLGAFFR